MATLLELAIASSTFLLCSEVKDCRLDLGRLLRLPGRKSPCTLFIFRCVHASLYDGLSVGPSVYPSDRRYAVFLIAEIEWKRHRIIGKVEIWIPDLKQSANNL